jgi:hypothetical protein
MNRLKIGSVIALAAVLQAGPTKVHAQPIQLKPQNLAEVQNVVTKPVPYRGKSALEVRDRDPQLPDSTSRLVFIKDVTFRNGTIDVYLSGDTAADAPANFRGFTGIAFHISPDRTRFDCIYLRPKNGHSPDPVQHGHATQYVSQPDYPWNKLRAETPGKYESSADIMPGDWIHVRIQISGKHASLFVNDSKEPTLVVNELLGTVNEGPIALWVGPGTIANFAGLKVTAQY